MIRYITFLLFILISFSSFAQVVIEEKIELGVRSNKQIQKGTSIVYTDSVVSGFIMPRSGVLQVYFTSINHFDWELPDYSTLNTYFFKGDSTSVDSLINRFTSYIIDTRTIFNYCPPSSWEHRSVWMYLSPDPYLYELGNVSHGDSVQMIYHSDMSGVAGNIPISEANEVWADSQLVGWQVIFKYLDACIFDYVNELQMFVGVLEWDSLYVEVVPDTIYPGDTAQVVVKKRLPDGTLVDFDSTLQFYEVGMLDGCILGKITASGQEGSHVYNVSQPIYFVADTSADSTGSVLLRVGLIDPEYKPQNTNSNQKDIEESDCFVGWQTESYYDATVVKDNPLKIIYPKSSTTLWITYEPQMPTINCSAIYLKFHNGIIKYEWKFMVEKYYERRTLKRSPICDRVSRSEFQGLSYSNLIHLTTWSVPFNKDSGYFYFKAVQEKQNKYYPKEYYGCDGDTDEWYDETSDEIFTGGEVFITLTAKDYQTGEILAELDKIPSGKILGFNPDSQTIYSYANSNKIKAIMQIESKEYHFIEQDYILSWWPYNEVGWPIYGSPNGYGLMQLDKDPAGTERQLWNWKANIDGGKTKLQASYNIVAKNHGAPNEDEYDWTNAFHEYNHGNGRTYYKWTGRKWDLNPNRIDSYGYTVYKKYTQLGGGN
ncbi:MAG: hypothetical protein R6W68_13100 [Ignavibacteriaceae bacterium]